MRQKVLVTDMDDVLVNLLDTWTSILNSRYSKNVKLEDIQEWDMHKAYPDLNDKQLFGVLNEDELWMQVRPKEGSPEYLLRVKDMGYRIFVCTAAHYKNISKKITLCLLKYYPWLTYKDIIMCHDKELISCDYIIDDYHNNIKRSKAVRFLMDAPYNKIAQTSRDFDFRVNSMEDVYNILNEYELDKVLEEINDAQS